jgi:hypothetical protein
MYWNTGNIASTFPANSSLGFAQSIAFCNPGDTSISGQHIILPMNRNFFPGTGSAPESLAGSYMNGFESLSKFPTNNGWIITVYGNNLQIRAIVKCFDN